MDAPLSFLAEKAIDCVIECTICTNELKDPRSLPCLHTFCFECLEKWMQAKQSGDHLECPICRKHCILPVNGLAGLTKNFFIEKLKRVGELVATQRKSFWCEVCCSSESQRMKAVSYCAQCHQKLCQSCSDIHSKLKGTQSHICVNICEDIGIEDMVKKLPDATCTAHTEKALELYCFECKTAICLMCFVEAHQRHKCVDVNKTAEDFRLKMVSASDKMTSVTERFRDESRRISSRKAKVVSNFASLESQIHEQVAKLNRSIDNEKDCLLNELASMKRRDIKQLDSQHEEIERHMVSAGSLKRYIEELQNKGTACDIARQMNNVDVVADELTNCDIAHPGDTNIPDVRFETAWVPVGNMIGKLYTQPSESGEQYIFDIILTLRTEKCGILMTMCIVNISTSSQMPSNIEVCR